jgi:hypothetical protein
VFGVSAEHIAEMAIELVSVKKHAAEHLVSV